MWAYTMERNLTKEKILPVTFVKGSLASVCNWNLSHLLCLCAFSPSIKPAWIWKFYFWNCSLFAHYWQTSFTHVREELGSTGYPLASLSPGEKIPQRFWVRQQHVLLLCCQIGNVFAFSPWGQISGVFPKELLIWKIVCPPLNNFYHLINDSDWSCQH